jgi:hypothetical protein
MDQARRYWTGVGAAFTPPGRNVKPNRVMPRKDKINLEKIKASLFTLCTECCYKIPPAEERRIDGERMRCPKCGAAFIPGKAKGHSACEYDPN